MNVANVYRVEIGKAVMKGAEFTPCLEFFIRVFENEKECSSKKITEKMEKRYYGFAVKVEKIPDIFYFGNTEYPDYELKED